MGGLEMGMVFGVGSLFEIECMEFFGDILYQLGLFFDVVIVVMEFEQQQWVDWQVQFVVGVDGVYVIFIEQFYMCQWYVYLDGLDDGVDCIGYVGEGVDCG